MSNLLSTSQCRRAATSIAANIAEGYGRFADKDREHFYVMAQGSLFELDSHFQIASDLGYINPIEHTLFIDAEENTARPLSAFIRTHRSRGNSPKS